MGRRKLQYALDNLMEQKSLMKQIRKVSELRGEKFLTSFNMISDSLDAMVEELTSAMEVEITKGKNDARSRARERFNRLVESEGCRDLTIDTIYSRGTEGWNVADMVLEVKNLMYKMYASGDIMRGPRYNRMYSFIKDFEGLDEEPKCEYHGTPYVINSKIV